MLKLRLVEYYDPELDDCGEDTVAVLEIGSALIPLCADCINELNSLIMEIKECLDE